LDHAVAEAAFIQQLELEPEIGRERRLAASQHDGRQDQPEFVDHPQP
jgi:hypothetical protein